MSEGGVIPGPSLLVVLSEAKNLVPFRINSARYLIPLRAGFAQRGNVALALKFTVTKDLQKAIDRFVAFNINSMEGGEYVLF